MVSGINSSISSLLAAGYSPFGQAASAQQIRADELAAKERLKLEETLKAQTTIQPVSRDGRSPYQGAFIALDQRQQSLKDLVKPKADIAPSDEVQLFGEIIETSVPAPSAQTIFEQASDGVFYAVNESGASNATQAQAELRRNQINRQQQVADLYLRNFNAQFDTNPAYSLAA